MLAIDTHEEKAAKTKRLRWPTRRPHATVPALRAGRSAEITTAKYWIRKAIKHRQLLRARCRPPSFRQTTNAWHTQRAFATHVFLHEYVPKMGGRSRPRLKILKMEWTEIIHAL